MNNSLHFRGNSYGKGTVVKIYERHQDKFKFYSNLVFEGYDSKISLYNFKSLYNSWDVFYISKIQLEEYIEEIVEPHCGTQVCSSQKVEPNYIDGMASAWTWYIIIMLFGILLKGVISTVIVCVLASIVFFTWRRNKINGE